MPPTSMAWPWCSPGSGCSGTERNPFFSFSTLPTSSHGFLTVMSLTWVNLLSLEHTIAPGMDLPIARMRASTMDSPSDRRPSLSPWPMWK